MPEDAGEGLLEDLSFGDAVILALLTVIGVVGFYLSPVDAETLVMLDFGALVSPAMLFTGFFVLPIAWVANMSFERFRIESLAAFLVLPGVFRGGLFAVVCLGLPIAVVFASYLARSTYNGKNPFWTCFKTGSSLVMVMAILMASAGAYAMATDQGMRDTVRSSVTDRIADRATVVANETLNSEDGDAAQRQRDMIVSMIARISRNVSATTILSSRRSIEVSMDQLDGTPQSFTSTQRTVISQTFDQLGDRLPQNISQQVANRVEQQLEDQEGLRPSGDELEEEVRNRIDAGLDALFDRGMALVGVTFVMVLSLVYTLKIPFELLAGVLGYLLYRIVA